MGIGLIETGRYADGRFVAQSASETFYEQAVKKGVSVVYEKYPGVHNWEFWDVHIQDVLNWMPLAGRMVES